MARSDKFEMNGIVKKALPGTKFEVEVITEQNVHHNVICTLSGKLRQNFIKIIPEDKVIIEISQYDISKGIIVWRDK